MKNIITITVKLLIITLIAGALLGVVYGVTKDPIAEQVKLAAQEARQAAFPDAADFQLNETSVPDEYSIIKEVYNALDKDGNVVGVTVAMTTKGYSSGLNVTVGIGTDGKLREVIVGDNNETPGLGKKASEPAFQGQFTDKPYDKSFNVIKGGVPGDYDIQAITGATITSRGVTGAVNTAVKFYNEVLGGVK